MKAATDLIAALRKQELPKPPRGAYSVSEIAAALGCSDERARNDAEKIGARKIVCRGPNGKPTMYFVMK